MCTMNVGYARFDITPEESIPLMGFGNTKDRLSNNVLDPLYATCIAFVNEAGEKALVFTIDFTDGGCTTTTEIRPLPSARPPVFRWSTFRCPVPIPTPLRIYAIPDSKAW